MTQQLLDAGRLALGSWHIFSRLTRAEGAALVRHALDLGITLFDIGDYWDHALSNEVRFAEIVRDLGLRRDEYRIGIKVFTNSRQTRADLVQASLDRLGIGQADYIICSRPNESESLVDAVHAMSDLVDRGFGKAIAVSLWQPPMLAEACAIMQDEGLHRPKFLQMQYNVCRRSVVESPDYRRLFAATGIGLQAADTLEGGILTGQLHRMRFDPGDKERGRWFTDRNIPRDSGGIREGIKAAYPRLQAAAASLGATPAQLALAFCLLHPQLDSLLFGASSPAQLDENIGALALARNHPDEVLRLVAPLALEGAAPPPIFDVSAGRH